MARTAGEAPDGMAWIPAGSFTMGSGLADFPEEGPPRTVTAGGFWMDTGPVCCHEVCGPRCGG